uniref:Uncharacterized protein n=1 Tax=Strongyloides stercoralis TaxID=6248 RepID=A0AAF5DQU5_STRER
FFRGNSGQNEYEEDVLKRRQEPYSNKFNNINNDYVSKEYYDNNKYFNSQTNHYHSLSNNFDHQQNKKQLSFYEKVCNGIKNLYSNIKYYLINIYHGFIYILNFLWLLLSKPFLYLFTTIIYIIQVVFETLIYFIKKIWNYFFNNNKNIEGNEYGLRKKNDDISENVINKNIANNQLLDEKYLNRDYIKESECGSIANTQVETLKDFNENKYEEKCDESLVNLKKYNGNDNLLTQKDDINIETNDRIDDKIINNNNNVFHRFTPQTPPTPPPPLDNNFLNEINKKNLPFQEVIDKNDISSYSQSKYQNMNNNKKEDDNKNLGDWTTSRNVLIIDTNKNEKLNDNNFIFNNMHSKNLPPFNPVKEDFFIGNSVFKPISDMEIYKKQFNRQKIDIFHDNTISPSVPNITRNIREGTTFDVNIHGDELKNKNYYVTSPEDRDTPTFNTTNSFSNLKNTSEFLNLPKNYDDDTMSQIKYNIGNINDNPTLLSCKRTFERRVISRSYNQDSQGHFKKDWEVESYQAIKNEMPVSYNFYTRSAYK